MNVKNSSLLRTAGLLAGAFFAIGRAYAADTDAFPVFDNNYIKFSATGSSFNDGSKAASQRRTQLPSMGAGGIEAFSYTKEVDKQTTWEVDGKALGNAGDYLAQFKLSKNEVGSFDAGYSRFRTFYDGLGGFFPINNNFMPIYQRANYVDRGKFFVGGKVELPKAPVYTFRYENTTRTGTKDSTIWGETSNTGIPIYNLSALNPVPAARKIVPASMQLNERQQTFEASVRQSFGKSTASLSVVGTRTNNNDVRTESRYEGEAKPFPLFPSSGAAILIPSTLANTGTKGFDRQGIDQKSWTFTGKIDTAINDNMNLYAGASYQHATGGISGTRSIAASINTVRGFDTYVGGFNNNNAAGTSWGRPPYSYAQTGDIKLNIYTANVGVQTRLTKDFRVDAGVKAEDYAALAKSIANYVNNKVVLETGVVTPLPVTAASNSRNADKTWTPAIDARYTGIKNVSFFGDWEYRSSPGTEVGNAGSLSVSTTAGTVGPGSAVFNDKVKEKHGNYKIGANWAPLSAFSVRTEFFRKDHQNRFDDLSSSAGGFYILDYDIYGLKNSAQIRLTPTLSFTTRYIVQRGKATVTEDAFAAGTSGDTRRYQLSESINWSPSKVFFVQGDVAKVYDQTKTAYPHVLGAARDVIRNSNNNYWNGSIMTGFVVDKYTNATLQGSYYKADNYEPALAATTMTYGASGREYSIAAGVTRKFSDRWLGSAKIGYFESRNDTAGGFANFHGPLAYVSIEHKL